ncbi:MAG TPA: helix-turn-helix transcriptional regulator, partial [Albitalea sp.]
EAFPAGFAAGSAELQRIAGLAKLTVWRMPEAERHFAQAETLYAARGDVAAAQCMAGRRAAMLVALGRLSQAAAVLEALGTAPLVEVEARLLVATATYWLHMERGETHAVAPAFERLLQQLQSRTSLDHWGMVPAPRHTACRGMGALLRPWARGALAVAGDAPVPLRAAGLIALGWHALWQGRPGEAADWLDEAVADAQWTGHGVILRNHTLALRALVALARGDAAEALSTMRVRVDEHPAGYGDLGLWHTLYLAARVAAACGDAASLRDWLQRLVAVQAALPDALPWRQWPVAGLHGSLAALEGRRDDALAHWRDVLAHEEAADLFGHAGEVRVRMAAAASRGGARAEAAAWLRPLLEHADDGPRGAIFAAEALAALAHEDWAGHLDAAAQGTLRAWGEALARSTPPAPSCASQAVPAIASAAGLSGDALTARELEVVALIARGQSNKLIARALELSPHTVKRHVANALAKLGLTSRGQAAAWFHAQPAAQR